MSDRDREARFEQADNLYDLAALQDAEEAGEDASFMLAGRYRVVSTLGQGGMGLVYQAHDTQLDRTVAIKTILPQYLANPQASTRFFREARALARLNHPHILTLYDAGQDGGLHFLVMELGGRDLVRLLEQYGGALPLDQALPVALAVGSALQYAHGHGVIHRDLKPANVLVGTREEAGSRNKEAGGDGSSLFPVPASLTLVKVMDFGLAKIKGDPAFTAPQAQLGTPHYMSPEQVLGQEASERSDLYAFGVLLYELVTGVRPFDGGDVPSILRQHLSLDPVPPSVFNDALPQTLEVLILRLLEKDPSRRPATAGEVIRVLERLARALEGDEPLSPGPFPPEGARGESTNVPLSLSLGLGHLPARSAFVGRVDELAQLRAEYEAVAAGAGGRLLLIAGEPGAGKTRLVRELGLHARLRGGQYLEGHYLRDGGAAYGPWIDALRTGLRGLPSDELAAAVGPYAADLSQILPELAEQLGPFAPGPRLAPEAQRRRLYDGITEVVLWLAGRAPVVVLVDDLQWAPGLTLLAHLARRLPEGRVLLVGAYREQEFAESAVLVSERDDLNRARLFTPLSLRLLSEEQTAQLVASAFGPAVAAALGERVYRTTRGNAFFVEEVLRTLVESGAVRPAADGWAVVDPEAVRLPESLKLAVEGRVARLGDAGRDLLIQAAVLGQEFSFGVLRAMTGLDEDALAEQLDPAISARLVRELPAQAADDRFAFHEDQVQEVLYGGLTALRRRRLHLRAGQAIESVAGANPDPWLEDLARHFVAGNDAEKGADYAYRAGRKLDRLYAWSRSIPLYLTATDLWEKLGGHLEQRAAVYEQLGDAAFKSAIDAASGIGYFLQALTLYEQLGDRRKQATLHSQIGREYAFGINRATRDFQKGREHLNQARTILEEMPQSAALSLVYGTLAVAVEASHDGEIGMPWARKALDVAEQLQSPVLIAQASSALGMALIMAGNLAEGFAMRQRAWQLASQHSFAFQADEHRSGMVVCSIFLKAPRFGLEWVAQKPDYRTVRSVWGIPEQLITVYALLGDLAEGTKRLDDLRRNREASGQSTIPSQGEGPALVMFRRGAWTQAQRLLEDALQRANTSHEYRVSIRAAQDLGALFLELSEYARAEAQLRWSLALLRRGKHNVLRELGLLPHLCELYVKTGRVEPAELHLQEAQAILANGEDWCGLVGDVARAEGMVRAAQGRWPEAEAAFQKAQAIYQQYELKWDEAKLYYEWGSALAAVSEQSERGRALLGRAMEMWDAMGAGPWADKCRARLAAL